MEAEWLEKNKAEDEEETRCVKGERCPCFWVISTISIFSLAWCIQCRSANDAADG